MYLAITGINKELEGALSDGMAKTYNVFIYDCLWIISWSGW